MGTASEQGKIWGARAKDWAEANEPVWEPLYDAVLDRLLIGPGTRLLDIGCGAGGFLVRASKRGAEVAGLDASAKLAEIARKRLPGSVIETGEMEALPFPDQAFSLVSGINSIQFAGNVAAALGQARRVCREGGRVAMLVWGRREDCDLLSKVMPAVVALLPQSPPAAAPPPAFAESGVIEALMAEAGLAGAESVEIPSSLGFSDAATASRAILSAAARAIRHSGVKNVRRAVAEALAPLTGADGSVVLNNVFRLATGFRQ
ncbi:MAG: class I SAM-dependent methyltransferase [Hyphomicrobiales bacterium]